MNVVTGETMQWIDRRTMSEFGISGTTLMENAGRGAAAVIIAEFGAGPRGRAVIMAGKGNNGGDGFVIARILRENGWQVTTIVIASPGEISGDARVNLDLLKDDVVLFCPEQGDIDRYRPLLGEAHIIVDALLGTGLKSEVRGSYAAAVDLIDSSGKPVISVDIPSGIDAGNGRVLGRAVKADHTVTFALAKLGHCLYPGSEHTGRLHVVDIGIPPEALAGADVMEFLDAAALRDVIRKRDRASHKGNFGHCLILAGSTGKTGAAAMAANSAVRSGSGLVTLAAPASLNPILEIKTTEAMTLPLPDEGSGYLRSGAGPVLEKALEGKDALALGPGISNASEAAMLVLKLVEESVLPMVVDADGLNALSHDPSVLLRKKSHVVVLTPHPGEMARLVGVTTAAVELDRIAAARTFAMQYRVYLVLKGAGTVIAAPDGRIAVNGSGNPGMATGGMGDVLTGVLVSLLGQGYEPSAACRLGVFIHGHAADLVAAVKGEIGMSAVDVQEALPLAFKELMHDPMKHSSQ